METHHFQYSETIKLQLNTLMETLHTRVYVCVYVNVR